MPVPGSGNLDLFGERLDGYRRCRCLTVRSRDRRLVPSMADIPAEFQVGATDGETIARFASGVQTALRRAHDQRGHDAGLRLVQAGFLFRSAEIGSEMAHRPAELEAHYAETKQLVEYAGGMLSMVALASTVDLVAAAIRRFWLGPVLDSDPGREADVQDFPDWQELPNAARRWVEATRSDSRWSQLKAARDDLVHRHVPVHITIQVGRGVSLQELELDGERRALADWIEQSRDFVVERFVEAGLLLLAQADAESS